MTQRAETAMAQIKNKRYDEALRDEGRCDILAYGIAFAGSGAGWLVRSCRYKKKFYDKCNLYCGNTMI